MVKPKDISPPCERADHRIVIHDRVWYVPVCSDRSQFQFPGWHSEELFPSTNEVRVEYCSGNGAWIAEKATLHPECNWLAVEKRFDRARKIWSKIKNHLLPNLVVAFAEGLSLSTSFFPDETVSTIYVNFPDPWPKNRHAKHRLISMPFFIEAARVLRPNGSLIFVTDDDAYSAFFSQLSHEQTALQDLFPAPGYTSPPEDYGTSFFDSLFRSQGKPIRYHQLVKANSLLQ